MYKREYDNFDTVIDYNNLYRAMKDSCHNVRWKNGTLTYENNASLNLWEFIDYLENNDYVPDETFKFQIKEPKVRNIESYTFKDKVFLKSLNQNALVPAMVPTLIYDNGASVRGKGSDHSRDRLELHMHKAYNKWGNTYWVLRMDVHHYFPSIVIDDVMNIYRTRITDKRILKAVENSMRGCEYKDVGIGLGNEPNQTSAVSLLSPLDHYIKGKLQCEYYGRYMDDSYILCKTKEDAQKFLREIKEFLKPYKLELNEKTNIYPVRHGIKWIGFKYILTDSGKVVKKILKTSIERVKRRLRKYGELLSENKVTYKTIQESYRSWRSYANNKNNYYAIRKMDDYFNRLFILDFKSGKEWYENGKFFEQAN